MARQLLALLDGKQFRSAAAFDEAFRDAEHSVAHWPLTYDRAAAIEWALVNGVVIVDSRGRVDVRLERATTDSSRIPLSVPPGRDAVQTGRPSRRKPLVAA